MGGGGKKNAGERERRRRRKKVDEEEEKERKNNRNNNSKTTNSKTRGRTFLSNTDRNFSTDIQIIFTKLWVTLGDPLLIKYNFPQQFCC